MSYQGVCAERQDFVKNEEGQHVPGERNPNRARQCYCKEKVEAGLVLLFVASHVTNGIERIDDPKSDAIKPNSIPKGSTVNVTSEPGKIPEE